MGARILNVIKGSYKYGKEENEIEFYGVGLKLELSLRTYVFSNKNRCINKCRYKCNFCKFLRSVHGMDMGAAWPKCNEHTCHESHC